jgi:integrase/recombinase XerD
LLQTWPESREKRVRAFPVVMPSGVKYWTVLDEELAVVSAPDAFLRHVRLGRDDAELTTKSYAGSVALYLRWCTRSGRDWRTAAADLGLFITWLRHATAEDRGAGSGPGVGEVLAGPGRAPVRGARRINGILAGVRGFLSHAVTAGQAPGEVMGMLYELADDRDLPAEARGEWGGLSYRMRARHRLVEPERPVDRASDEEIVALLRACRSCRDRLIVLLMARAGLRRGEAAGLRREDLHFMPDSSVLGCPVPGAHLHVVRRNNPNGAWAKSRRQRAVPVDFLLVQAYDQYVLERSEVPRAETSDFVLVNLFREPLGAPMPPDALGELISALAQRARVSRKVTAHMLRHACGSNIVDAGGTVDEVQEVLGHAQASSSQVYLHPDPARLRAAVERVPSPRLLDGAVR